MKRIIPLVILLYSCSGPVKFRKPTSLEVGGAGYSCRELLEKIIVPKRVLSDYEIKRIMHDEAAYEEIFNNDLLHHEEKLYFANIIKLLEMN